MSTWTVDDVARYAKRRLKQEEPARVSIQSKVAAEPQCRGMEPNPIVSAFFREHGIPHPVLEALVCENRRWRWDFSWPKEKVALECNGGLWNGGAHVRPARMLKEYEKWNEGAARGWRILFVTPDQLCTAATADLVKRCLGL